MNDQPTPPVMPADAIRGSWVASAPTWIRPYLQLSRYDRPIGFWLLGLPCLIAIALARLETGFVLNDLKLAILFAVGSLAMRGAGCTYNDILDKNIDAKVERTALRPLPSGAVSTRQAWVWLLLQCAVGLIVLLNIPHSAKLVALASLPLVALYPLMKRITWWPQIWLGLTMNWGAPVAAMAIRGEFVLADVLLYIGLILWTVGYDTIYAIQDKEDDALIGVRSTARLFGKHVKPAIGGIYFCAAGCVLAAGVQEAGLIGALFALPFALHLLFQFLKLRDEDGGLSLRLFKSNRDAGLLLLAGWMFSLVAP